MDKNKIQVTITDLIDNEHKSHFWYGGQCAKIEYKGYVFSIEAIGDVYWYCQQDEYTSDYYKDKNNSGRFYNEMCNIFKNDDELYAAIDNDELIFDYNNWWECFVYGPDGEFHDLTWDLDASYLDEAIEEVKEYLESVIADIEEEDE